MGSMKKLVTRCAATMVACVLAAPAIGDLKKEDFRITEDNQEQKIAFYSKEVALPITLALLLDTSGSEQFMLSAIQDAGSSFLRRILRKGDEALVMSFDSDVDLLSDFTDDHAQLDRAVRRSRINIPSGGSIGGNPGPVGSRQITGTALYDAIYLACGEKLNPRGGSSLWSEYRSRKEACGRNGRPGALREFGEKTHGSVR
jgi:VWFA-related protein